MFANLHTRVHHQQHNVNLVEQNLDPLKHCWLNSLKFIELKFAGIAFENARAGEKFQAHVTANCKANYIVYFTECCKCKKIGWGDEKPCIYE